ncbi:unnamed protein product [Knipowitschia caucasica]
MAQSDSKVLLLGALAGAAGLGLAVACYQGYGTLRRRHSMPAQAHRAALQSRSSELVSGLVLADGLPRGQAEVLDRLEALIQCVSELKEEMKSLKTALPSLQEAVRDELSASHRASPLHRAGAARRRRAAAARAERSSEEAESEGG